MLQPNTKRLLLTVLLSTSLYLFGCASTSPKIPGGTEQNKVTIGTGGVSGVYYPTGDAICKIVNKGKKEHGIQCEVKSTKGSVSNLKAIASGKLDMGIAQSDWQYHAYEGTSSFLSAGANKCLRSVFSIHPEPFTVVARVDSGIRKFDDLKGKRVNIGNPDSLLRGIFDVVMDAYGWTYQDFQLVTEFKFNKQTNLLCNNQVDAIVFSTGHPSGLVMKATRSCEAVLVQVSGPEIDSLVKNRRFFRHAMIPGWMYPGTTNITKTFGLGATLVASCEVPEEDVYNVVKSVFENFNQFKKLHPAFMNLKKKEMIKDSLTAPLHDGARKYYQEAGLM